jgi:hypothetical protein
MAFYVTEIAQIAGAEVPGRGFRIIDESGEDYLYPTSFFLPVRLSARAVRVFRQLA